MSMDVTMQVIEAQDARSRMQEAKKRIKAEVKRKYEARITQEVAERSAEAEYEFARTLAKVHASGVSQAILRRDVLRTNVWGVWTYWRDLAEIEPERKIIRDEKAERKAAEAFANSHFRWSEDYGTVTVVKNSKGDELEEPVIYTASTIRVKNELFNALPTSDRDELVAIKTDTYKGWMTQLHNELEAQIEAGNITPPEGE